MAVVGTDYKVCQDPKATVVGYKANGADLSAKAGRAGTLSTDGKIGTGTAGTVLNRGIIVQAHSSETDAPVSLCTLGRCPGKAGGTWGEGDALTSTTDGTLIATTTLGDYCVGTAASAAASGDFGPVDVNPFRYGTYA